MKIAIIQTLEILEQGESVGHMLQVIYLPSLRAKLILYRCKLYYLRSTTTQIFIRILKKKFAFDKLIFELLKFLVIAKKSTESQYVPMLHICNYAKHFKVMQERKGRMVMVLMEDTHRLLRAHPIW